MYALFVQDDWRLTPDLKLLYGLRYDVYQPPDGDRALHWSRRRGSSAATRTTCSRAPASSGRSVRTVAPSSAATPA